MKSGLLALGRQRLERLVVLVDVQVFAQGNVNYALAYAALIHSCIERTLAACSEHNSRHKSGTSWGYKLFDSSLSPLASSSSILKLLKGSSRGLRHIAGLKSAEENLGLFQQTLSIVAAEVGSRSSDPCRGTRSKADFVVRALQELLSDFTWNSVFISDGSSSDEDQVRGKRSEGQGGTSFSIQQNLVMVFSHLPENMQQFASFMNMSTSLDTAKDIDLLYAFSSKMKRLREPFRVQGIRACWIDMPCVSTSVVIQGNGVPVPTETDPKLQSSELHGVFAQAKWKYTTMDALAIASECLPPAMVWSSVAYPDLQVQPDALRMQAKLRITVHDRDGKQLQPDICRLQVVPLGSSVADSAMMKESVSAMLKMASVSSKAGRLASGKCPSLQSPIVKIVVKSLLQKQDVPYKCSLRYLLYHRADYETDVKTKSNMASAGKRVQKLDPLADDAASDIFGHDILKQLQQEPMSFEPGERSWQVLLIAIARNRSVAEVDLHIDGKCNSAILEPITIQYAALLLKDQSSKILSSDCSKQLLVQCSGSKSLTTSPLLHSIVKSEDADFKGSDSGRIKQEIRPRKRTASTIPVEDAPVVKREKLVGGFKQKPNGPEEISHNKREAFSWVQHWRHILRRKTVGTGKVQIENRYMRPRQGQKPSKSIQIIKCWLDQASKSGPPAGQQLVLFSPATPGSAEPVIGEQVLDPGLNQLGDSEMIRLEDLSVLPQKRRDIFSALLSTKEQAECYLSSMEQMLQDCLQGDSGDLQLFVKGILSNATRAQQILLKTKQAKGSICPPAESMQCPIMDDDTQADSSAQKSMKGRETVLPCNSDSSCASNVSKAQKADHSNEVKPGILQEMPCSVSGVGNGVMPDSNCIDYGGSSDGADSAGQMALVVSNIGTGNQHEATDESQPKSDESDLSEMVAELLMDKLLVKPKKLAKQYKDLDSASSDIVHIRKEKLRAYELQILFRMELIERDCGGPLEKEKIKILKEICRLLDDIQFDLGGGVFGNETLHDYSIRVIQNRYKEHLPQTVADIFERMEFNGYVEGMSELQAAPDSTHAAADLVGSHDRKETEREELVDNIITTDAATRPFVAVGQPTEDKNPTPSKGRTRTKSRRKRSAPMDAFTRASEKRKLAGRLAHFGGQESLHRLKKVKIHHQSPKPPKVSSSAKEKYKSKEHNVVLETPRFERQNVRAETPQTAYEEDEVESICTQVRASAFGFGTPARVSKHMQPTTRKRRLALFNQKKPPGRGLPRISRDVMKALAEGETMHHLAKSDRQLDPEILAHNDCAGESTSMYVSQSSQEQRLPDPGWRSQPSADVRKDSTDLTGWVLRESGDQGSPEKNAESSRRTELGELAPMEQARPSTFDATVENSSHRVLVTTTEEGVQQQAVHDSSSSMLMTSTMSISTRKNRRKSLHTSKSRKPDFPENCSKPQSSVPATQTLSPPSAERDLFGAKSAAPEPVEVDLLDVIENSKPMDLTSLDNRWNDDKIPCSPPVEISMNCASGYGNAQQSLAEKQSIEVDSERINGSSANLAKRHGFLSASRLQERASRSSPKASLTNFSELGGETELLFETQILEEVYSQKHRFRSPKRALYEDTLCLSPSDAPLTWEMPFMDLNGTQMEQDRVVSSQSTPIADRLASPGRCNLHSTSPFRINQTSEVCRVDPPSSPLPRRLTPKHEVPLLETPGLIAEDPYVDLEFTQIMNEIFHATNMMEETGAEECQARSLVNAGEGFDDYSLLLDENWSPLPRLKPEARLSSRTPTDCQRKKGALDEDTVAAITGSSPVMFSSPTLNRKFRRPDPEGSPGQIPNTPNAANCKKRPRSTTASPKETPKAKRNKMLRFT
ncbi:hypothetical protein KC19_7G063200 [Ceratodon purpureus]|uniref:Uncharacterized protein n=1 Tax=Ceratodon purpureus TaxID=3225 RepID=A0A8T0H5A3_CERPU|nr:hypothetical protein KC19_7G063200 [Ceratodon purpureus]